VPKLLGIPTGRPACFAKIKSIAPTGVPAFHDIDQCARVAVIAIVVTGEQISVVIERQPLRIAQTAERKPPSPTHQGCSAVRPPYREKSSTFAFLRRNVQSAVAAAEIEPAIRPDAQTMQIMPRQ